MPAAPGELLEEKAAGYLYRHLGILPGLPQLTVEIEAPAIRSSAFGDAAGVVGASGQTPKRQASEDLGGKLLVYRRRPVPEHGAESPAIGLAGRCAARRCEGPRIRYRNDRPALEQWVSARAVLGVARPPEDGAEPPVEGGGTPGAGGEVRPAA